MSSAESVNAEIERLVALIDEREDSESLQEARLYLETAIGGGDDPELFLEFGRRLETAGARLTREGLRLFERSVELDPSADNTAHNDVIIGHARLLQTHNAIAIYKERLAAAPENVAEYCYLASAYLWAGEYEEAAKVVQAGLELEPENPRLIGSWGAVLEGRGQPDEALATWERVYELEGHRYISSLYSRVFLLARLGRLEGAIAEWERIIAWVREHDMPDLVEWPEQEIAQLRRRIDAQAEPDAS